MKNVRERRATLLPLRTEVKGRLLLNIVVGKCSAVLELLSSENQALLIRRDALLVLDLGLDIVDGVGRFNLKGDCLASKGLNKDLHDYNMRQTQVSNGSRREAHRKCPMKRVLSEDDGGRMRSGVGYGVRCAKLL
jgi:hypothetical protein